MKDTWTINVSEFGFLEKEGMLLMHIKKRKRKLTFTYGTIGSSYQAYNLDFCHTRPVRPTMDS